jgi:hypothetical protein
MVELALELDPACGVMVMKQSQQTLVSSHSGWCVVPVQTESVQEGGERLHDQEHAKGGSGPDGKAKEDDEEVVLAQGEDQYPLPEHGGELRVGQRQGPQAQVGGSVGDGSEHELDRVNDLVNEDLAKVELLSFVLTGIVCLRKPVC